MTQSNPQTVQTVATQFARVTSGSFAASMHTLRMVALSLLVDRALSA